jgi:hypothetical protein
MSNFGELTWSQLANYGPLAIPRCPFKFAKSTTLLNCDGAVSLRNIILEFQRNILKSFHTPYATSELRIIPSLTSSFHLATANWSVLLV